MKTEALHKAVIDVTNQLQIIVITREDLPIKNRQEAIDDLAARLGNLGLPGGLNGKRRWRLGLIELAAYALFAAVSDD
jgi:hypothetical protein